MKYSKKENRLFWIVNNLNVYWLKPIINMYKWNKEINEK